MHSDLDRLIRLHRIDHEIASADATIRSIPERRAALEARLTAHEDVLAGAKARASENHGMRRELEKALAALQSRLSRYKDQLMAVKTNREYAAMQTEIAGAEAEIKQREDQLLEALLNADELTAAVKAADATLAEERTQAAEEVREFEDEARTLRSRIEELSRERAAVRGEAAAAAVALYDQISQHRSPVMAEARDGHCTACHVRLRPQRFNEIRRSDQLFQCESCKRLLYFVPGEVAGDPTQPPAPPGPVAG